MSGQRDEIDQRIWQVVALIPEGTVATYGDVACQAGLPGGARRVGRALRKLPPDTRIPWHRVVNAGGGISLEKHSVEFMQQRRRLEAEGVRFSSSERLSLDRYRWRPGL